MVDMGTVVADPKIHLVKLSVGSETVESLMEWQSGKQAHGPDGLPRHVTRMWPRREAELQAEIDRLRARVAELEG